jgi:hypothetical protein
MAELKPGPPKKRKKKSQYRHDKFTLTPQRDWTEGFGGRGFSPDVKLKENEGL